MTTKKTRKARMTGTTRKSSIKKNKKYYGSYDLTEDLTGISRKDLPPFDAERKKIEPMIKDVMSLLGYPKGTIQIPVEEYDYFLSYIDMIYNGTVGGEDARLVVNKLSKNKMVSDEALEELCEKSAALKRQGLNELAVVAFHQWYENTMSIDYYKRQDEILKEIDMHIKNKISTISDQVYYQESKIKMLELYRDMLHCMEVSWDDQLHIVSKHELPLKEMQDELFKQPSSVINQIFNKFMEEVESNEVEK